MSFMSQDDGPKVRLLFAVVVELLLKLKLAPSDSLLRELGSIRVRINDVFPDLEISENVLDALVQEAMIASVNVTFARKGRRNKKKFVIHNKERS